MAGDFLTKDVLGTTNSLGVSFGGDHQSIDGCVSALRKTWIISKSAKLLIDLDTKLAVGYKHDRSFVVRGWKISVFKHTPNNELESWTKILGFKHTSNNNLKC
jgi:hypothetical protein